MLELIGLRLSRPLVALAVVGVVGAALAAFVAWQRRAATAALVEAVAQARIDARAACDAQWTAQIEKTNADVERQRAASSDAAAASEARAADEIATLKGALADMELRNAALPHGDACGLDRERVRLLPR